MSGEELRRRDREVLRLKVEAYARGEYRETLDEIIHFRVPPLIRQLYKLAPQEVKQAARRAFEAVLMAWFLGRELSVTPGTRPSHQGPPIIINMNLNMNNNTQNVNIDLGRLRDLIERLYELRQPLPPLQRRLVEELRGMLRN